MKNYQHYTFQDFIDDADFGNWVLGNSSNETFWITFVEQYPEKKQEFEEAERFIRAIQVEVESVNEKEIRFEIENFLETISTMDTASNLDIEIKHTSRFPMRKLLAIAAIFLVAVCITWLSVESKNETYSIKKNFTLSGSNLVKTNNDTEKPLRILLNDGTIVFLSPKSSLRYPSQFADSARIVYLEGEASFEVIKQGQSFKVYTGEVITKVLGTKFTVRAFGLDKNISVQVQTGKVSVSLAQPQRAVNKEVKGLILTANQEAIFEKAITQLSKTVVPNPVNILDIAHTKQIKYQQVPLTEILKDIEKMYGIPVQVDAYNFQSCKITATLTHENMYEKLDLLCKSVSATYEIVDGQIIISGNGCKNNGSG